MLYLICVCVCVCVYVCMYVCMYVCKEWLKIHPVLAVRPARSIVLLSVFTFRANISVAYIIILIPVRVVVSI
jgi:hypothetical protein